MAGAAIVGVLGAALGMALLGRTAVSVGPFGVELEGGFGSGVTRLELPPFGELAADTHVAPLSLSASLRDVGVERLTDAVRRDGVDGLVDRIESQLIAQVRWFAWRLLLVALAGGVALSVLVFRRRWDLVAIGVIAATCSVAGSETLAAMTYEPAAFSEPSYSGSLTLARDLIGPIRDASDRIESLRDGLEQAVDGAVRAYTSLEGSPSFDDGGLRVLHISDIHASPLGMDFAQQVARGFDVDLVVDTGDLTSFATPIEDLIASRIPGFGRPYVFVAGSHDPLSLQLRIAGAPNGIVLDGDAITIEGLTIYGLAHPAFTPARGASVDDEAFEALARAAGEVIAADLDAAEEPVDLIAVHDDRMAEAVAGRVPLVISGHFHETRGLVLDGTLFLRIGTTGASGAGVFRGLDEIPFSAEVLYFSPGEDPRLIAYDVIEQLPDSGNLTVRRVIVAEEYGDPSTGPMGLSGPSPTGI